MDLAPDDPTALGRYRVQSRLGGGTMWPVLLGVDEAGRRVALRVVAAEPASEPGFRERFRHGVQQAASAPPGFTAPVLDADPDAERPWVATQFVEGPSLQAYVTAQGPLGEQGVTALAVRMADGLVALHAAGLAHGNLTPSTVLLADDGPRVIDFGIPGTAGAPEYLSPEQAGGAPDVGPASDLFSFGSLLVFAATGRSPFAADSAGGSVARIVNAEPDLGPLTGRVREAARACLVKDPAGRATAVQVRDVLRAADAENQVAAEPTEVIPAAAPVGPAPTLVGLGPDATIPGGVPAVGAPPPSGFGPPYAPPVPAPPARRAWLIPVAAAVAVLLVAGIVVGVLRLSQTAGTPAAAGPTSGASSPSAGASPTSDPTAGATIVDAASDARFGTGGARFASPTRNIACAMTADQVRCDVARTTWPLPPKPAGCSGAFGTGAVLAGTGAGELSCVSDTVADAALPVLPYDQGVRFAGVVCVSSESGLRCTNSATGHGFRVARASYELF